LLSVAALATLIHERADAVHLGKRRRGVSMSKSTARRLAARIVEHLSYVEGLVEEAAPFAEASDIVLLRSDGFTFSVLCMVDAERDDSKRFRMERAEGKEILRLCRDRYCGTIGGAKQPARLEIVELRNSVRATDVDRLKAFSNRIFDTDAINAFIVDTSEARAITATRWSFWSGRRRFLEREIRALQIESAS
jgi:hypothetical protein